MGWYFTNGTTRKEYITELTQGQENSEKRITWIKKCYRGGPGNGILWGVVQVENLNDDGTVNKTETFITCDLMRYDRGCRGWGNKPMSEECHPYYYSCPLSYLDLAPVKCQKWRDKVLEWHKERTEKNNLKKARMKLAVLS